MTWLEQLWKTGQLGTVDTEVSLENRTIVNVAVAAIVVTVLIVLFVKYSKKI